MFSFERTTISCPPPIQPIKFLPPQDFSASSSHQPRCHPFPSGIRHSSFTVSARSNHNHRPRRHRRSSLRGMYFSCEMAVIFHIITISIAIFLFILVFPNLPSCSWRRTTFTATCLSLSPVLVGNKRRNSKHEKIFISISRVNLFFTVFFLHPCRYWSILPGAGIRKRYHAVL